MTPLYTIFEATHLGADLELEQSGTVLTVNAIANINRIALALFPESVGRWYAELLVYGPGTLLASVGIATITASLTTYAGGDANGYGYRLDLGEIHTAGAAIDGSPGAPVAAKGDIIGVLLDLTTTQPTVTWYRNGALIYSANLTSTGPWALAVSLGGSEAYGLRGFLNAGQRAFAYAPPGVAGWYQPPQTVRGVRLASEDWLSDPADDVPNERYSGLLAGDNSELRAVRSLDFWPWQRGVQTGAMVLTAYDADNAFAEILAGDARDLPVVISSIGTDQTYADRVNLFSAVIDSVSAVDDLTVKLTCRDPLGLLGVPLQRAMIRPDAEPSAANTPRPIVLGACRNVPTVLTDAVNLVYAVTDATVLGIGFVRDSGYPLDPTAFPADFALDAGKTSLVLHASPIGKVTADISSVGGDQLPAPADDILGGAGAPFTGADGAPPDGFDDVGGDIVQSTPVMNSGVLEFPLVSVAPTIYASVPIYTSGATGSVALQLSWLDDTGTIIEPSIQAPAVTGTQAWAISELIDTAPPNAVSARIEAVTSNHTAGIIRVGQLAMSYVRYGDHDTIGLTNGDFSDGLNGWTAGTAGWTAPPGGSLSAHYTAAGLSDLTNDGVGPVSPGDRVMATCRIGLTKPDGSTPAGALIILWLDASNNLLKYDISAEVSRGDQGRFTTVTAIGTAPEGAAFAQLQLKANNNAYNGSQPFFDDVQWDFVLDVTGGERTQVDIGTYADVVRWQLGQNWTLEPAGPNGYLSGAYAEHAHGPPGESTSLRAVRTANVRQAVSYTGWAGISTAKIGAGKSYQVQITIDTLPEDGFTYVGLATGTTIDSMLASWNKAGTYTVTITNNDSVDHPLYLLSVPLSAGGSIVPVPPTVSSIEILLYDDTYTPDPTSLVPANLQAIKLADYLHQVLDMRGATLGVAWSLADAQAIDTAAGYAGIGVYLAGGETVAQALDMALASYTACKWCDGSGMIRLTRMIAPESVAEIDRAGTIDMNAMDGDLVPVMDGAPGLTTQMGVRRNWAQFSDGDLVAQNLPNFPLAVRQSLLRGFQQTASSAQPLAGAYRHALYAAPVASCFDQQADGQAEIDRIAAIYTVPRWFYACAVFLDALPSIDLGQIWTLEYPKYGLASGKPVMVIDYQPDLLAGTANIILWG